MGKEADGEVTGDIKGSKISSSGVGSKKIIKLRGIGFDSEKKELLQKAGETGAGDNPNTPKKDGNTLKKEEEKFQNESSSIYTKSSLDSSSFNKLKNCILDKKEVLLNASLEEISSKLFFYYGSDPLENALYCEMIPGGNIQVSLNQSGEESKVNIEALFNTVHKHKELVKSIFNK